MNIDLTAAMKPAGNFFAQFRDGDQQRLFAGKSLLRQALTNTKPDARFAVADFLLDHDAVIGPPVPDDTTPLHLLFGHVRHVVDQDAALARRLIDRGVDINALDADDVLAFHWVLNMKASDDELAPIYDLWFARPDADFTTRSTKYGVCPLELAERLPFRAQVAARMKEYVHDHA